jgi:predicted sulfurtransferase
MSERTHQQHESIVLFYTYFLPPLKSPTKTEIEELHLCLQEACNVSSLKGRILLATEGINGTLSAVDEDCLKSFCQKVEEAWPFLKGLDWKFSDNKSRNEPFPDLKIAVVKEIVSTGNTVTVEDIPRYGGKHLTPSEFHEALEDQGDKETVVIDVRNTFEYNVGHFVPPKTKNKVSTVMNPEMVTFSSFNGFCEKNVDFLKHKKVLMYCTGGIRCEKASAMLQKRGVPDVNQLQGGIHRYLETFGENGYFHGKNFVFDQRVAIDASNNKQIVGLCINCSGLYDQLSGSRICTVCRDLVLVCYDCQSMLHEYHCQLHSSWKACYFTFLNHFGCVELRNQKSGLEKLLNESSSRNTKRTIRKQIAKVLERITALESGAVQVDRNAPRRCRTCREPETVCDGLCWGFWKRNTSTEQQASGTDNDHPTIEVGQCVKPGPDWNHVRLGDPSRYKVGGVVQVKSWAGGEQDCVAVLWDSESLLENHTDKSKQREHQSPQIYRFGVLTKDSLRKYDVVKVD